MSRIKSVEKDFSSGGLVWDAAKKALLMVQVQNLAKKKVWTFPKGHPEAGETDKEAALREVQEETGWQCQVLKPIGFVHYAYDFRSIHTEKSVRWFLMKPLKRVGSFDPNEILKCEWVDVKKARPLVLYDSDKDLLRRLPELL